MASSLHYVHYAAGQPYGLTPLHFAAGHGLAATQSLLEAGASVDAVDKEGDTPLHYAADKGHADVARALLEAGALAAL